MEAWETDARLNKLRAEFAESLLETDRQTQKRAEDFAVRPPYSNRRGGLDLATAVAVFSVAVTVAVFILTVAFVASA